MVDGKLNWQLRGTTQKIYAEHRGIAIEKELEYSMKGTRKVFVTFELSGTR